MDYQLYDHGLYVVVNEDGSIKRNLISEKGDTELPTTTIKDEIIEFSELNFRYYSLVIDAFKELANSIQQEDEEAPPTEKNKVIFERFAKLYDELAQSYIDENNYLAAVLYRTAAIDRLPLNDGSYAYMKIFTETIIDILQSLVDLNLFINDVFYNIYTKNTIDEEGKHYFLSQVIFRQELTFENGLTSRYVFRSLNEYYLFLLMQFLDKKPNITRCGCCGKYFVPKTKKATKYCDRMITEDKTCKEVAPKLKHKKDKLENEVIEIFDRTRHKMYQRSDRSGNQKDYWDWCDRATEARDKYVRGEISEEEALKIIEVRD